MATWIALITAALGIIGSIIKALMDNKPTAEQKRLQDIAQIHDGFDKAKKTEGDTSGIEDSISSP